MLIFARSGRGLSGDGATLRSSIGDRHGVHPDRAAGPGRDIGRDNVMDDSRKSVAAGAHGEFTMIRAQRPAPHLTHRPCNESRRRFPALAP